jgi:hypothetical protein
VSVWQEKQCFKSGSALDLHSFSKLDPDPHALKKLDPHKVSAVRFRNTEEKESTCNMRQKTAGTGTIVTK